MTSADNGRNPEKYAELSRHFIEKADESLAAGDLVQASEKGWGAVAQAVKSIAEERGWPHSRHFQLGRAAFQLSQEWGRPDLGDAFRAAEALHGNFYENFMEQDEVAVRVARAKELLADLDVLRRLPPRS